MNISVGIQPAAETSTLIETLAHELRQPLSAIESTAYYLSLVLPRGEKRAQEQALHLRRLCEHANWILSCALQLDDETLLAPEPLDLEELISRAAAIDASEGYAPPRLELAGDLPPVKLDPARGRFLIQNLLAMTRHASEGIRPVCVRTSCAPALPRRVALDLSVNACEIAPRASNPIRASAEGDALESWLGAGAPLGIECARRIVESHGGSFEIDFDPQSGVRVRISFPASSHSGMLPSTVAF